MGPTSAPQYPASTVPTAATVAKTTADTTRTASTAVAAATAAAAASAAAAATSIITTTTATFTTTTATTVTCRDGATCALLTKDMCTSFLSNSVRASCPVLCDSCGEFTPGSTATPDTTPPKTSTAEPIVTTTP